MRKAGFLALLLLLASAFVTAAQDKVVLDTDPPPGFAAPPETVEAEGNVVWRYISGANESEIFTKSVDLSASDIRWGSIAAYFSFKGKKFQKPEKILIGGTLASPDRTYVDNLTFVIHADDKILFSGKSTLRDGRTNGKEVYASIQVSLSIKDFKKLAKAKKIKFQIGPSTFDVAADGNTLYGDLIKFIENKP